MRHRSSLLRNSPVLFIAFIAAVHIFSLIDERKVYANSAEDAGITASLASITDNSGWSSGGPYGGYVYSLVRAASDANILYAGTDDGVYVSFDSGMSWGPLGLSRQSVKVVAVNPQDARNIYAGTDKGIQKSFNGGSTWAVIGPIDGSTGKTHRILDIAINGQNPLIVYAVTWVGESRTDYYTNHYFVKSTDGGQSWQIKFTNKFGSSINSVLIDSDDPQRIYIGLDDLEGGVYLSINGGDTWTAKRLPDGTSSSQEVVALAMTSAGSIPPRVYAMIRDNGVYASIDRGDTWTNTGAPDINGNGPWALTVDPIDPSTVCVGTRSYNNDEKLFVGLLYKTKNAGVSWVTHKLPGLASGFAWSPGRQLYAGFDNGVQKSPDQGESWQRSDHGMALVPIAGLAIDQSSGKVFAVVSEPSDNILPKYNSYPPAVSADQGATWSYLDNAPRNQGAIALAHGIFSTIWTSDGFKTDKNFYVNKSIDGGISWSQIPFLTIYPGEWKSGGSDILTDSRQPNCVLFGFQHVIGDGILARTTDGGYSWSELDQSTSALAVDPNDPDLVYRGRSQTGGVWAITNACGNWNSVVIASSAEIGDVKDIEVGSDSKVYVAASDGLWRWDKSSWVKLAGPPKGIPSALAIDRESTIDILYVGTSEEGVYSSPDGGLTWKSLNNGLGDLRIKKLSISTGANKKLYAGTWKGVWRTSLEWPGTLYGGWYETWMGWVNDVYFPWGYHDKYGWIYTFGTDPNNLWFYNQRNNDYWWTTADLYPNIYFNNEAGWFYNEPGTNWFYDYNAGMWEQR